MASDTAPDFRRRRLLFGRASPPSDLPASPIAVIAAACLALRGIACMTCRDACQTGAVRFSLAVGGVRPGIDADACTGCADCAAVCPASAITLVAPDAKDSAVA